MSGAQSWSVKGIDPKVREAAREAAARQGMSLGEYLSQALQNHTPSGGGGGLSSTLASQNLGPNPAATRLRAQRFGHQALDEEDEDWHLSGPTTLPRVADPTRLAQRIDAIERRTQLAVTGLDRAVSTIDRSVLGLAARVEDAEAVAGESAERVADALDQFRLAGDTLGGRLEQAELQVSASRDTLERARGELNETRDRLVGQVSGAQSELHIARERLENQISVAEEIARRAEAAANFLSTELENRDAALGHKIDALADKTRDTFAVTLADARAAAVEAARQASEASADAVLELRALQDRLAERLEETTHKTRSAIETAIAESRGFKETLLEEVVRLESEIGARIATAEQLKSEQHALIARIEKAEAGARESTAGLRQAAGAAIADLRNAQLGLAARLKQVEDVSGRSGAVDLSEVRAHQNEITERLAALEDKTNASPMQAALANFEKRLEDISQRVEQPAADPKLDEVGGAVKTLDEAMSRLATRIAEAESSANSAIRTLEETVSNLGARVESGAAAAETEAVRALLETRLDQMAQQTQAEIATQIQAALGAGDDEGVEGALADVNRRLAAAERRQAQTIEAISIEIKRMSETVDKRLRTVESRNEDSAASTVREELTRMTHTLEQRFDEIERREAAAFDRMGLEVGRLSERLEERVGAVEGRSAQAIEHVGEQVARMAERFNQRHELLARDLGERMIDSEERAGARVADAIGSIMQRLSEVEEHSNEAVAPVKKAVSSVASRLEALETGKDDLDAIPTPARRFADYGAEPAISPIDAAHPIRATPLPPLTVQPAPIPHDHDDDIYFADDIDLVAENAPAQSMFGELRHDAPFEKPRNMAEAPPLDLGAGGDDLLIDDHFLNQADAFAAPPPEDDDPFWTPDSAKVAPEAAADAAIAAVASPLAHDAPLRLDEPPPPPGKNDYLNAARKAAQAQSVPAKKGKNKEKDAKAYDVAPTPIHSLRGSSRVVLWGAASAVALLIAGGAWYMKAQQETPNAPPLPPPDIAPTTQQAETQSGNYDPAAPFGQPAPDPFPSEAAPDSATAPVTAAPITAAPTTATPASAAPAPANPVVSQAAPTTRAPTTRAPTQTASATPASAPRSSVVAGPLAPRSVSLEAAARGGDAVAQYELALQRIAGGHPTEAVLLLHTSADHGLAMAQYRLAKLYERGEGLTADLTLARQWTERAAAAGNRRAMHDLGVYFARGEGAPLDEAAAFRWFRQAAELGVADSQFNLGVLYQQGRGVGASASEAMFWFLVAARQGDEDAAAHAATLQTHLQPIQVDQARARAEAFRPRAASAIANGEFGPRPWTSSAPSVPASTTTPARARRPAA